MPVRIRLSRQGTKNNPFYHIVAIADHKPRDARPIEKLGEYDPIPRPPKFTPPRLAPDQPVLSSGLPSHRLSTIAQSVANSGSSTAPAVVKEKRLEWNTERIRYWLGVGAQPSKPVAKMLDKAGLIPEGKWFKGMYRPPLEGSLFKAQPQSSSQDTAEAAPSAPSPPPSSAP